MNTWLWICFALISFGMAAALVSKKMRRRREYEKYKSIARKLKED